jgi:hypothetical protein
MTTKRLLTLCILAIVALTAAGQEYYDLTEHYLTNSLFDGEYDYDQTRTGNVAQEMQPVNGWTNDYTMNYTVVGIYQVGSPITYNGASIPASNADGEKSGGVLALSTGWEQDLKLYQTVTLPAGEYKLVAAYYNGDAQMTAGSSLLAWIPSSGTKVASNVTSFAVGQWTIDELTFSLKSKRTGKIQIGFKGAPGGSGNSAKIAVDYVKLLRKTAYVDSEQSPTGNTPTVTTDSRFVRGATWAFGRMAVNNNGTTIREQGFCYSSQTTEPTISDGRSTRVLSNGVYWLKGLQPATKYYMRAYAITTNGQVGYGEAVKFYTVPKGNVSYSYNNGGDAAANARITNALNSACHYFNNMCYTTRHFNVGYSAGTPTADCNYQAQPWINIGAQESYQRTGTFMHEMQHGMGLQNYSTQWNKNNLRSGNGTGQWTGDRVTEALHFWDNNTTTVLKGDAIHMWPYGINGASEDNLSVELYLANAMLCQALGEDGLEHNETRHADPYYSFDQEDDVKYYIKNEAESRGRYTSYLVADGSTLRWAEMTAGEGAADDRAAWYITFTPENQYYQLRNAKTEQYLNYNNGIRMVSATDNWHLMRGRVDVDGQRGYWIIHPESNWTPKCLQANANGATAQATFDIANSAEAQRWLILTAEEARTLEEKAIAARKAELEKYRRLLAVPHLEDVRNADATLLSALADIEARLETAATSAEVAALNDEAKAAAMTFLRSVTPTQPESPFDVTWLLVNPTVSETIEGWTTSESITAQKENCVEFYQKTFDFSQTVTGLPAGTYGFGAQAFQRPGMPTSCSDADVTTSLYAGNESQPVAHAVSEAQTAKLGGKESEIGGKYIPNDMTAAALYFAKGLYQDTVVTRIEAEGALKVGIRCTSSADGFWTIFRNFHLYYYGNVKPGDANRDGQVDATDVACAISHLLGLNPKVFSLKAADQNADGVVDILDVTALIEKIRTKQ